MSPIAAASAASAPGGGSACDPGATKSRRSRKREERKRGLRAGLRLGAPHVCVRRLKVCGSQLAVCLVSLFVSVCRSCVSSSSVSRPPIPRWCPVRAWLFFTFLPNLTCRSAATAWRLSAPWPFCVLSLERPREKAARLPPRGPKSQIKNWLSLAGKSAPTSTWFVTLATTAHSCTQRVNGIALQLHVLIAVLGARRGRRRAAA